MDEKWQSADAQTEKNNKGLRARPGCLPGSKGYPGIYGSGQQDSPEKTGPERQKAADPQVLKGCRGGKAVRGMSQTRSRRYSAIGKVIAKQLVNKGMTAKQLADELGTTPQYLNKIIHGDRSGEKYLEAIRQILGIAA